MPAPAKLPNSHSLFPAHRDLASSLLADGGFSLLWWATPSPGTHSLCPGFASKPQALTTKSVLLSGGLTSDVRSHPAKPRTQRTCPAHFSAVEGLWLAATNSMSFPPHWRPMNGPLGSCWTQGRMGNLQEGAPGLSGFLLLDPMPAG